MSDPLFPPVPDGMRETDIVQYDRAHPVGFPRRDAVILERPLSVEVDGTTYTLLRTPGADRDLVAQVEAEGQTGEEEAPVGIAGGGIDLRRHRGTSRERKIRSSF